MKTLKLFLACMFLALFTISIVSAQAEKIPMEFNNSWECYCVGEYLDGSFSSVLVLNANGQHWRTTGTAVGYSLETGEPTGNIYEIKNVENYAFKLRSNGSYSPDKFVMTMQIRLNGKKVALTHRSYEINYDENGEFRNIIWGGFFCSPN